MGPWPVATIEKRKMEKREEGGEREEREEVMLFSSSAMRVIIVCGPFTLQMAEWRKKVWGEKEEREGEKRGYRKLCVSAGQRSLILYL